MELYLTVAIIIIGIILFVRDYFSIDTTSIIIMALFIVSGVLSPEEGFFRIQSPSHYNSWLYVRGERGSL